MQNTHNLRQFQRLLSNKITICLRYSTLPYFYFQLWLRALRLLLSTNLDDARTREHQCAHTHSTPSLQHTPQIKASQSRCAARQPQSSSSAKLMFPSKIQYFAPALQQSSSLTTTVERQQPTTGSKGTQQGVPTFQSNTISSADPMFPNRAGINTTQRHIALLPEKRAYSNKKAALLWPRH